MMELPLPLPDFMPRLSARPAVFASFLALTAACRPAPPAPQPTPSLTVATVAPRTQTIAREVRASGAMAAWEEIQIGAALQGVRVEAVLVEVGDAVRKDDVVVRLDARAVTAQLARTDAAVREAQASLVLAESRARRTRALAAESLVPAQNVDDVDAAEAQARAQLETAQANRAVAQLQVDFAVVRAPEAGVISARSVQPGQVVGNSELLRLIRGGRLEWRAELDEADLMRVALGAPVELDGVDGAQVAGRAYVFLVDKDQRARQRLVELGVETGDALEIRSGLDATDAVVARGAGFLNDGDLVRVTADAPAATAAAPGGRR
jgi:multidrug efflux pump subunit AcrA (membrane-fusion protein)